MRKVILATAAAAAVLSISPASAQSTTTAGDQTVTAMPVEDEDNDFPWGLLGLLGLAGLLGRKRDDLNTRRTS